ncbi:uncharacterized protein, partial [Amphiura filiformis]|uniref:uncharacterized protein n=1 Tax=Amphiura filiformis TaxID=82378 RepID=UPI003B215598
MAKNFTYLSLEPGFADQTTTECMEASLESYSDRSKQEETFEVVTRWVNYDLDKRKQVAKDCLKKFELHCLSSDALQKALDDGMKDIPECKTVLEEVIALTNKTMSLQQAFEISQRPENKSSDFAKFAKIYMYKNFIYLSKHPDFLDHTTTECMETFLKIHLINTTPTRTSTRYKHHKEKRYHVSQHETFKIVTSWVNHDLDQRKQVATVYFKKFELHIISTDALQKALDDGMKDIPECKTVLEEVIALINKTMSLQQAFEILQHPEKRLSKFAKSVKKYMEGNVVYLSKQQDFLDQTTTECMDTFLKTYFDKHRITYFDKPRCHEKQDHCEIFEAVTRWVIYDLDQRKQLAMNYLTEFELHTLHSDILQKALDGGMRDIPECKRVLEEVIGIQTKTMSLQKAFEIWQQPDPEVSDRANIGFHLYMGKAHKYMTDNFIYLSKQPDFLDQTTTECMETILATFFVDSTNNRSHYHETFVAVIRWVNHDLENRKELAIDYLEKFKPHKFQSDILQKALDDGMKEIPECKTALEDVLGIQNKTTSLQRAFEITQQPDSEDSDSEDSDSEDSDSEDSDSEDSGMAKYAKEYMEENFTYLSKQPDFLDQTTTECMDLFLKNFFDDHQSYRYHKEKVIIFEAVTRWINHDLDHRKQLAIDYLSEFELHTLQSDILQKALDGGMRDIPECKRALEEVIGIQTKTMSLQKAFEISQQPDPQVSDTAKHAKKYMEENFTYLSKQSDFLDQTTTECMEKFLQIYLDYSYRYHKERHEIFEAVTRWVNHDLDHRKQLAIDYLQKFKLQSYTIPSDILQKALDGGMRDIPECKTILEEAIAMQTKTMSLQKAFEISQRPDDPQVSDIAKHAKKYMEENFTFLSKQPDFLDQTTAECMEKFLKTYLDYRYGYHKEKDEVFEVVTRWINHDLDHRKQLAIDYLEKFKLHTIPSDILQKALDGGMIDIPECKTILEEVIALQTKTMSLQKAFEISQRPDREVSDTAKKYMKENFTCLSKHPDFLDQTTSECMEKFLQTYLQYYKENY